MDIIKRPNSRLNIEMLADEGFVTLRFERPIKWMTFTPEEAENIAHKMLELSRRAKTSILVPVGIGPLKKGAM